MLKILKIFWKKVCKIADLFSEGISMEDKHTKCGLESHFTEALDSLYRPSASDSSGFRILPSHERLAEAIRSNDADLLWQDIPYIWHGSSVMPDYYEMDDQFPQDYFRD